jgi:hypothetical protein
VTGADVGGGALGATLVVEIVVVGTLIVAFLVFAWVTK